MVSYAHSATGTRYVLGIDIGGQSIKPELYEVKDGKVTEKKEEWQPETETKTKLGVVAHAGQIADIIAEANKKAQALGGKLVAVGIGSPGRFREDGTIKPGTNTNMGLTLDEFDEKNLKDKYKGELKAINPDLESLPLTVGNDGNAMLAGMVQDIVNSPRTGDSRAVLKDQYENKINPSTLLGQQVAKRVALFGIGTGLGHAIVDVDGKGGMHPITDGHASKLRVPVDEKDWPMVEKAIALMNEEGKKPEVLAFPDHTVRAEDLMRDPVLKKLAGVDNAKDIDWAHNPEHEKVVQFAGKYMGRLIALIKSGQSDDVETRNGWSLTEKEDAAKTEYYLIGGGVGGKPLGAEMIRYAQEVLVDKKISDVKMVQYTRENPAARAAAMTVPAEHLSVGHDGRV